MKAAEDCFSDREATVRVAHAGEYGIVRILAGQLAVMGTRAPVSAEIEHMATEEEARLAAAAGLLHDRGVRPTLLMPLWKRAGFALGAASALAGPGVAMAVTRAARAGIGRCRNGEVPRHGRAVAGGAGEEAPAHPLVAAMVRAGCRLAARLGERL